MTTADGGALPKYLRVAAGVRRQIADGTLRPGQPAPSGAELSRESGFSTLTCRKALRALIADGVLVPGPSRNARPRVADPRAPDLERDLADAARALSAGLAARRHAAGLTQAGLAALARVSVTTVGHAETGRTWQSRRFWERADTALHADGELLRLHDAFRAASSPHHNQRSTPAHIERSLSSAPAARAPATGPAPDARPVLAGRASAASDPAEAALAHLDITGIDRSQIHPPRGGPADSVEMTTAYMYERGTAHGGPCHVGLTRACASHAATPQSGTIEVGTTPGDPFRPGAPPVGPSRIIIVWTDGTVTTVHAPEVSTAPPPAAP